MFDFKEYREKLGLTKEQMADALDLHLLVYSMFEDGKLTPSRNESREIELLLELEPGSVKHHRAVAGISSTAIMRLFDEGKTCRDMGEIFGVKPQTIRNRLCRIGVGSKKKRQAETTTVTTNKVLPFNTGRDLDYQDFKASRLWPNMPKEVAQVVNGAWR